MQNADGVGPEEKAPDVSSTDPNSSTSDKESTMTGGELQVQGVPFYGEEIQGAVGQDGTVYAVPKRICENIGVNWATQFRKLQRDPMWGIVILTTPSTGGDQQTCVIPARKVAAWLFTIQENKVAPEVREKIRLYREECVDVLDRHFRKVEPKPSSELAPLIEVLTKAIESNQKSLESNQKSIDGLSKAITLYSTDVARLNERVSKLEGHPAGGPVEEEYLTVFEYCRRKGIRTNTETNRWHTQRLKVIVKRDKLPIVPKLIRIVGSGFPLYHWPVSFFDRYFSHEANRMLAYPEKRIISFGRTVDTKRANS